MDQEQRFQAIMDRVSARLALQSIPIAPDLAEPKAFLKVLRARHYNWQADRFTKLFGMRFSVKVPQLEQLNTIFYPKPVYDVPIFIFFCLLTKRKLIAHLNVNCPFDDSAYMGKYVVPLTEILHSYAPFESKDRYPEWMKKYRNSCTIYGMFPQDRIADLTDCVFRYLDVYLELAQATTPVHDPERLERIREFQDGFRKDIRTQDKAQGMIARMIGAEKAKRIFYEITT